MPKSKTLTLEFLLHRGTKREAVERFNEFARMTPARPPKFKRLPKYGGDQAVAMLSRSLEHDGSKGVPNTGDVWLVAIECPAECALPPLGNSVTTLVHVEEVTNNNFDALKAQVNRFAKDNRVTKFDVNYDEQKPGNWAVFISYLVAYD